MSSMANFKNSCAGCKKLILSYAVDRSGTLATAYCNSICETAAKIRKQYNPQRNIVTSYDAKFASNKPVAKVSKAPYLNR